MVLKSISQLETVIFIYQNDYSDFLSIQYFTIILKNMMKERRSSLEVRSFFFVWFVF